MGKENTLMYSLLSLLSDGNTHLHCEHEKVTQYSSASHNLEGTYTWLEYFHCMHTAPLNFRGKNAYFTAFSAYLFKSFGDLSQFLKIQILGAYKAYEQI